MNFIFAYTISDCQTIVATGGNISINGNQCIHTFIINGTFNLTRNLTNLKVLVVAGGGQGGSAYAGGGGAGGLIYNSSYSINSGIYPVVIGLGGSGAGSNSVGNNGKNSSFNNLIAIGGGGGAGGVGNNARNGGSGGGKGNGGVNGLGILGQGNNGGNATEWGNGGGGSGTVGGNSYLNGSVVGGMGGNGTLINITGIPTYYAGGGGGAGSFGQSSSLGGLGGGGRGEIADKGDGSAGVDGLGGGGGGRGGSNAGRNGGSGIVILSYEIPTVPSVQFVSPTDENDDSYQRQNILVNLTSSGTNNTVYFFNSTKDQIGYSSSASSPFFVNFSTGSDGIYYFNATSCNSMGCNSTETRFVNLDTFNPIVDIFYPDDISYPSGALYNYFVNSTNFTAINTGTIDTCWIILNDESPIYVPNCTEGNLMTYTGLNTIEGLNNLTIYANDTVSLQGYHEHQFYIDTIPPTLIITSPLNNATYTSILQILNITSNGTNIIYNVNDGFNQTYSNATLITFLEGSNNIKVWSYDLAENVAYSEIDFIVNIPANPPSYFSNPIYQVMNSSGAGLGIFIQILGQALPLLLIGLAFVGIIVFIGMSIKKYLIKAGDI